MDDMEKINSRSYLMRLMWPLFIELVLQMLVSNVDQIMVAKSSDTAVAAIGNANVITNLLLISFSVISMAATILITQYIGSGSREKVALTYTVSMVSNAAFGVVISLVLLFGTPWLLALMHLPAEVVPECSLYLRIVGGGMILQAVYLTFVAFLRSNALTKQGMIISIIINLINIAGNFLLIGGIPGLPALGVAGAAISSVLSRLFGCILIYWMFLRNTTERMHLSYLRPFPKEHFKRLMIIGIPSGGESISYNLSQIVIQTMCNFLPLFVITSRVYSNMFATLSFLFVAAMGQATQIIVGFLMGARRTDETDQRVNSTLRISCLISFIVSLLLCIFCKPLFGLFTSDPQILNMCQAIMFIEIFLEQGRAGNIVLIRALQAAGDIRFPILLNVFSVWVIAVGVGYLLGITMGWGLQGIWIGMALDECFRAVVLVFRWRSGKWREKHLI